MATAATPWLIASADDIKHSQIESKSSSLFKELRTRLASGSGAHTSVKSSPEKQNALTRLKTHCFHGLNKTDHVDELYELGEEIGKGAFGLVRLAKDKATGVQFCCKSIARASLTDEMFADIQLEAEIMMHLRGHPNIVEIMGMFEDDTHIHIVEELCSGGDLYSKLTQTPVPYTEVEAAAIMRTVLEVLQYAHGMGVIYRDCKPDNFLLTTKGPDAILKATDFGISKFIVPGQMLDEFCGTPTFMAPECFNMSYSFPSDVWSAGVMMYWVLSGQYPFKGRNKMELARKVCAEAPLYTGPLWEQVTPDAIDCLKLMLTKDPAQRPTPAELLSHKWFKVMAGAKVKPLGNLVLQRMQAFAQMHDFKKEVMRYIASCLDDTYLIGLRTMFAAMDVDKSGNLSYDEVAKALTDQGAKVEATELRTLMSAIDEDHDGTINFNEFVSATINSSVLERQELLKRAFHHFDRDGDGSISRAELAEALREKHMKDKAVDKILAEVDKNADGHVDFDEFCSMLLECPESGKEGFKLRWRITKHVTGIFSERKTNTNLPNLQPLSRSASRKNSEAGYSPRPGSSAGWKELVSGFQSTRSQREGTPESGGNTPVERKRRASLFMMSGEWDAISSDENGQSKLSGLLSRIGIQLGAGRSASGGLSPQATEVSPQKVSSSSLNPSDSHVSSTAHDHAPRPSCLRKVSGRPRGGKDSSKQSYGGNSPPLSQIEASTGSQAGVQTRVSKRISWVMDSQVVADALQQDVVDEGSCPASYHRLATVQDTVSSERQTVVQESRAGDNDSPAAGGTVTPQQLASVLQGLVFLDTSIGSEPVSQHGLQQDTPLPDLPLDSGGISSPAVATPFAAWSRLPETAEHTVVAQCPPGQSPISAAQQLDGSQQLDARQHKLSSHPVWLGPCGDELRVSDSSTDWPEQHRSTPGKHGSILWSTFECFGAADQRPSAQSHRSVVNQMPSVGENEQLSRGPDSQHTSWTTSTVDAGPGHRQTVVRASPRTPLASGELSTFARSTPGRPFKRNSIDRARDCSIQ